MLLAKLLAALACACGGAASAEPLALTNATVIDGTGSPPLAGRTIVIEDGIIRSIFVTGERVVPEGAAIVDLGGRTVLPGLIDGHVHLIPAEDREAALRALLHSGVTAVREGDHYVVSGQKMWTSYAQVANRMFCLVRTDPDARKQAGISLLLLDMDMPGISIRPGERAGIRWLSTLHFWR